MSKGKRRERQAAELYERAGYETYRPQESKFGETDMFNLFDLLALGVDDVRLVQVKSNGARGYREWAEKVAELPSNPCVVAEYAVAHDNQGWRILGQRDGSKHVWVDERDMDCAMGEGVVQWLEGDSQA